MRTYGVPWNGPLPIHPLSRLMSASMIKKGFVSILYNKLLEHVNVPTGNVIVWNTDLKMFQSTINWQRVWSNIPLTSRNHNNQLIHYKMIQRYYLSPRKRCQLQISQSPLCSLCTEKPMGTYVHMMWECPEVLIFWRLVSKVLSQTIDITIPCLPHILLLNDDSSLNLTLSMKRVFLTGLTAAKKMLVIRWKPPHKLNIYQWKQSFYELLKLEASSARAQRAHTENIQAYLIAAEKVCNLQVLDT